MYGGSKKQNTLRTVWAQGALKGKGWSWRESNPRPNEEKIGFLHAYLCLSFRAPAEPKPSTDALSSKDFISAARPATTISDLAAPLGRNASEQQLPSDVSFQHLVPELSFNLLYFD